jgi:hypothetical protein
MHRILLALYLEFLAKREIVVLAHPPYSTDSASANSFLFPKLKMALKGTRSETVSSMQHTLMRELKAIWEEAFSQEFDLFYE